MQDQQTDNILRAAQSMAVTCGIGMSVFDYSARDFWTDAPCQFCETCTQSIAGHCDYQTAHTYGSYEAERWQGQYVYSCPSSLTFLVTTVYEERRAAYALVAGPVVMGQVEDLMPDSESDTGVLRKLPQRSPGAVNHILHVQHALAMFLSGYREVDMPWFGAQPALHNALYDVTDQIRQGQGTPYPVEIERRLQTMMVQGDKTGARELINQLLGALYFNVTGDLTHIKERAKELIVLFSRASIEGGADAQRIFGQNESFMQEIDRLRTLDELSVYLTNVFYRFVGYVFDFRKFEHTDIMHKAVSYMRENLSQRVTLEGLAAQVSLSRSYLSTIFKSELGRTFTDYINTMRIEKSKEYLLNTSLSLVEISDLVGYSDQSYFTKKFVKQTGMSPGQYRKKRGG